MKDSSPSLNELNFVAKRANGTVYTYSDSTLCVHVTGGQPLKLAHSLLGYAVGMTDINRPGWPITRKQTHRNKF